MPPTSQQPQAISEAAIRALCAELGEARLLLADALHRCAQYERQIAEMEAPADLVRARDARKEATA